MAGEAQSTSFVLGTATVMIGPRANVFELTPDDHSIGLVKNFTLTAEPGYLDLTQGVRNTIVYSVMTSFPVRATMEVYEFTSKNLMYGMGLDGTSFEPTSAATTGGAAPTTFPATPADKWWIVQENLLGRDLVFAGKSGAAIPATMGFTAAARIRQMNMVPVGKKDEQPFLGAKVVGILPENNEPITVILPKVRIQKGFTLAFTTDNYSNMPFEMTPFDLTASDPHYSTFRDIGVAMMLTGN